MISEEELAQLRADEETLMPDTCRITRAGAGESVFDEETGEYTDPDRVTVYEGACRVAPLGLQDRAAVFGERAIDLVAYQATLPYDAPAVEKDDHFEVLTTADARLAAALLEVHGFELKSLQTKRRLVLQEVRA